MNDNTRTISYLAVAAVLALVAFFTLPKPHAMVEEDTVGSVLFPDLKDPKAVRGLELVTYDEVNGKPVSFKVSQTANGWSLPAHSNYPADAEKQVANAATSLVDLIVLSVVSKDAADHEQYGVIEPDENKLKPGAVGVGKLVKVLDKSGKALAQLVIGKEDKLGENSEKKLRFVRQLPYDVVYRVELPGDHFSTEFADWIETDLLKLDGWEISQVTLKDYNVTIEEGGVDYDPRSSISLAFDDKESKWTLKELFKFEANKPVPVAVGQNEELNNAKLNDLKSALDDLKIVSVHRKPEKMSGNLKAEKTIFADAQAVQSLIRRGFYPIRNDKDEVDIMSSNGEVMVRMKDGIEYTLRFGDVAGQGSTNEAADKSDKQKPNDESSQGVSLDRFIMVTARFDKSTIAEPMLMPVPELPGQAAKPDTEANTDAGKSEEVKSKDAAKNDEASKGDAKTDDAAKNDVEKQDAAKTDASKAAVKTPSADEKEELILKRKQIEKENERKQKEYEDKIATGERKARDLNERFAEWYYVVSEATYRKIHLSESDVIKAKTPDANAPPSEADEPSFGKVPLLRGAGLPLDQNELPPLDDSGKSPKTDEPATEGSETTTDKVKSDDEKSDVQKSAAGKSDPFQQRKQATKSKAPAGAK